MKVSNNLYNYDSDSLENLPESTRKIVDLVMRTFLDIEKVKWSNEKLETDLWRRTIDEVIKSGETFYMKSCADFTLTFMEKLKNEMSDSDNIFLGIEKLRRRKIGTDDIHLYVEVKDGDKRQVIDFARDNLVYIYNDDYKNIRPDEIETTSKFLIPPSFVNRNDSIFSIAEKIGEGENIEKFANNLRKLQNDNTDFKFEHFQKRMDNMVKVNIGGTRYEINLVKNMKAQKNEVSEGLYSVLK